MVHRGKALSERQNQATLLGGAHTQVTPTLCVSTPVLVSYWCGEETLGPKQLEEERVYFPYVHRCSSKEDRSGTRRSYRKGHGGTLLLSLLPLACHFTFLYNPRPPSWGCSQWSEVPKSIIDQETTPQTYLWASLMEAFLNRASLFPEDAQ